ncbi:palmitoyl-acyl carrier protein thioesterase, chloroplastic-like isoform X2 [Setaria viridis]|uniref:palmitoyl-acyl carrier protein thioesterase, chloroplastic-like isoform X2 n=1 Tax=Setaria viridis TaxID=4556 RepID=UPI003B3BEA85
MKVLATNNQVLTYIRQNFSIRSYEIEADRMASIETLMNHLQETALNHVKTAGLLGDGFGSTPEMSKRNLFWVVSQSRPLSSVIHAECTDLHS